MISSAWLVCPVLHKRIFVTLLRSPVIHECLFFKNPDRIDLDTRNKFIQMSAGIPEKQFGIPDNGIIASSRSICLLREVDITHIPEVVILVMNQSVTVADEERMHLIHRQVVHRVGAILRSRKFRESQDYKIIKILINY